MSKKNLDENQLKELKKMEKKIKESFFKDELESFETTKFTKTSIKKGINISKKYKTEQELKIAMEEYVNEIENSTMETNTGRGLQYHFLIPTVKGLKMSLEVNEKEFARLSNKYPDYFDWFFDYVEDFLISKMNLGLNPISVNFNLKNNHGYRDVIAENEGKDVQLNITVKKASDKENIVEAEIINEKETKEAEELEKFLLQSGLDINMKEKKIEEE